LSQLLSKVTVTSYRYYIRVAQKLGIIFVCQLSSSKINLFSLIVPLVSGVDGLSASPSKADTMNI